MSAQNPPSGWTVSGGEWGTDYDRDESVFVTMNSSVKWVSGATTTDVIWSPWVSVYDDDEAAPTSLTVWMRSRGTTTGSYLRLQVYYYQADKATQVGSAIEISNRNLASANNWEIAGGLTNIPSTARWARFRLFPIGTLSSNTTYLDELKVEKVKPVAVLTASTSPVTVSGAWQIAATGWTADTETMLFTSPSMISQVSAGTSYATVYQPGFYHIEGKVFLEEVVSGDTYMASIFIKEKTTGIDTYAEFGPPLYFGANYTATAGAPVVIPVNTFVYIGHDVTTTAVTIDKMTDVTVRIIRVTGSGTPAVDKATLRIALQ